jgi:hypothetical protein
MKINIFLKKLKFSLKLNANKTLKFNIFIFKSQYNNYKINLYFVIHSR